MHLELLVFFQINVDVGVCVTYEHNVALTRLFNCVYIFKRLVSIFLTIGEIHFKFKKKTDHHNFL